jgi:hypothetical protein
MNCTLPFTGVGGGTVPFALVGAFVLVAGIALFAASRGRGPSLGLAVVAVVGLGAAALVTLQTRPADAAAPAFSLSVGAANGAAGSLYYPLILTNTGSQACSVGGYPTVALEDAAGHTIAVAGHEVGNPVATFSVAPGGTASTVLHTEDPGIHGPGCFVASSKVHLTIGGVTYTAAHAITTCPGFTVRSLVPGSNGV